MIAATARTTLASCPNAQRLLRQCVPARARCAAPCAAPMVLVAVEVESPSVAWSLSISITTFPW